MISSVCKYGGRTNVVAEAIILSHLKYLWTEYVVKYRRVL